MRYLLDVNVLIALVDPDHVHSDTVHNWWASSEDPKFATCPLTENGCVRILSNPNYSSKVKFAPQQVVEKLTEFAELYDHEFWPDSLSLRDPSVFKTEVIYGPRQITDIYLLALAIQNGGSFLTLDTNIPTSALSRFSSQSLVVLET